MEGNAIMLVNGSLICPRCKMSSFTYLNSTFGTYHCDGCKRSSNSSSWDVPQADDEKDSPFYGRPDLREMIPEKVPGTRAPLVAADELAREQLKANIEAKVKSILGNIW